MQKALGFLVHRSDLTTFPLITSDRQLGPGVGSDVLGRWSFPNVDGSKDPSSLQFLQFPLCRIISGLRAEHEHCSQDHPMSRLHVDLTGSAIHGPLSLLAACSAQERSIGGS